MSHTCKIHEAILTGGGVPDREAVRSRHTDVRQERSRPGTQEVYGGKEKNSLLWRNDANLRQKIIVGVIVFTSATHAVRGFRTDPKLVLGSCY